MISKVELKALRTKGDPLADDVVKKIIQNGDGHKIGKLFNTLTQNIDVPKDELPKEAIEYFENTKQLPDFYNPKLIKIAQDLFSTYGPEISMLLLCKSLPQCYACGKGAKVLYHTGRLVEHDNNFELLTRRLMETTQFVINVLSPDSFANTGKAIITTQKIRLIHASIRYFIKESGKWDYDYYGVPINQEDLSGTLMSFSSLILEGLKQLEIDLSEEQKEAYFHIWRVIGFIIGIDHNLIPKTAEEGLELTHAIMDDQLLSTKEGIALTDSAIKFMEHVTPGKLFDKIPEDLVYYLLGPKIAETVGVTKPKGCLQQVLPTVLHRVFNLVEKIEDHPELKNVMGKFNRAFLQGMLTYFNEGKKVTFDIPPSLQKDWNIN